MKINHLDLNLADLKELVLKKLSRPASFFMGLWIFYFIDHSFLHGELALAPVFTDHAVFQAGIPIPIFGTANPLEEISVTLSGKVLKTKADSTGAWRVNLDAMEASEASQTLTVASSLKKIILEDLLIGEVWLCSGQSNMFMPLEDHKLGFPPILNSKREISQANFPLIRLFSDHQNEVDLKGWRACAPQTVASFSATAYFFGRAVHQKKNFPVGLIHVSRGGSPIVPWTPKEEALAVPFSKKNHEIYFASLDQISRYNEAHAKYVTAWKEWDKTKQGSAPKQPNPLPPEIRQSQRFGDFLAFERLIQPIVPYGIRGVLWYQGEGNSDFLDGAQDYDNELQALVSGWRRVWGQGDFPFYFVQLPRWKNPDYNLYWPETRLSMLRASKQIKNSGMAVIIDAGNPEELHPNSKIVPGERLAQLALAKTYDESVDFSGPIIQRIERKNSSLTIYFEENPSPLECKGKKLTDFEIAGADGIFVSAEAEIEEMTVTVRSENLNEPIAVRYGWEGSFEPTLFNKAGFPASPFSAYLDPAGKTIFRSYNPQPSE